MEDGRTGFVYLGNPRLRHGYSLLLIPFAFIHASFSPPGFTVISFFVEIRLPDSGVRGAAEGERLADPVGKERQEETRRKEGEIRIPGV